MDRKLDVVMFLAHPRVPRGAGAGRGQAQDRQAGGENIEYVDLRGLRPPGASPVCRRSGGLAPVGRLG